MQIPHFGQCHEQSAVNFHNGRIYRMSMRQRSRSHESNDFVDQLGIMVFITYLVLSTVGVVSLQEGLSPTYESDGILKVFRHRAATSEKYFVLNSALKNYEDKEQLVKAVRDWYANGI